MLKKYTMPNPKQAHPNLAIHQPDFHKCKNIVHRETHNESITLLKSRLWYNPKKDKS
ncbi:MAG: hypothetical protein ACD_73C00520G0001, partial [uncultured bacterium]